MYSRKKCQTSYQDKIGKISLLVLFSLKNLLFWQKAGYEIFREKGEGLRHGNPTNRQKPVCQLGQNNCIYLYFEYFLILPFSLEIMENFQKYFFEKCLKFATLYCTLYNQSISLKKYFNLNIIKGLTLRQPCISGHQLPFVKNPIPLRIIIFFLFK